MLILALYFELSESNMVSGKYVAFDLLTRNWIDLQETALLDLRRKHNSLVYLFWVLYKEDTHSWENTETN